MHFFLCVIYTYTFIPFRDSGALTAPIAYRATPVCFATSETSSSETYERSYYYEIAENTRDQSPRPNCVKSRRSLIWPPPKPVEDITYPTASPIYINPNPVLDGRCHQAIREKRASIEACKRALTTRRERQSESIEREIEIISAESCNRQHDDAMDRVSCPGQPMYRRVELVDTSSRTSRSDMITSRPSSTDSVRRSLTPTRIVQPIPKPWIATVSGGSTNLYEQSYMARQEQPAGQICKKFMQREVCHRERIGGKDHREEQRAYRAEICRKEQTICPRPPLPVPRQEQPPAETVKEIDTEVTDLRGDETDEVEVSGGIQGEHDLITETTEETVDGMRVEQSATFEKTVKRMPSPERSRTPMIKEDEEDGEQTECFTRRTETHIDRTVEDTMEERTVGESAEVVTSAIDAQQMLEKAKQEEEERKREEEEEERRKEEEERQKREEEERKRQEEEEERRRQKEEEEKAKKHVTFDDEDEEVEEVREQPLGRTVVREERITESDGSAPGRCKITKETYEEITEEVLVQERVRRKGGVEDERRKSLREQVEVHQSLRDQQAPERRSVVKYSRQPQETMETCKKRVQFLKETETGPKPLSDSPVQNSTPKEWKSEMVNALTTAPDRSYTPLNATSSVKELYTEETIYLDHRCRPKPPPPREEIRPISPFQQALTIAPERSYTPLSREIGPEDQQIASRSQTPSLQTQNGDYCPPLDILYGKESSTRESYAREQTYMKKEIRESRPRPLPTPPPDYRLRDSSASPSRSRPETPKSPRTFTASLKKPDTIPAYQRNLVAMKKGPVEGQPFVPSRTPTPTPGRSKSPAQGPPEPPACYVKAQAPRIREDPPPSKRGGSTHFPSRKTISYNVEEDTDSGHRSQEYSASRTVNYDEKETNSLEGGPTDALYAQFQETRCMTSEETSDQQNTTTHMKKALQVIEDYEKCERKEVLVPSSPPQSPKPSICAISKVSHTKPTLPCPMTTQSTPTTARQPTYSSSSTEVRHVRYETPSPKPCPETGVTILPCKAHSNRGTKTGIVVMPCDGSQKACPRSGVCVMPTNDRSGVCVSPCFGMRSGECGQLSGICGRESSRDYNVTDCSDSNVCVTSCPDGSVCVAPCKKPAANQSRTNLPFPNIPLPYEEIPPPSVQPQCSAPSFKPRTNLSGQLARLTAKNGQQNVPTIQLYKPIQPQCQTESSPTRNYTESTYCHTQRYRETHCESGNQCPSSTRNQCQDQIHCDPPSKTQSLVDPPNLSSHPDLGTGIGGLSGPGSKSGSFAGSSAPKRGRGILNQAVGAGSRIPLCAHCNSYVRYSS